jgi:hypothetical protein
LTREGTAFDHRSGEAFVVSTIRSIVKVTIVASVDGRDAV